MQLQELKKELDRCRLDIAECQNLIEKREKLLEHIHELKESVELKLLEMHSLLEKNQEKATKVEQQITEESEKISNLRKKLKEIDAKLDQIGEEKESTFLEVQKRLISKIQELFPEAGSEYLSLNQRLSRLKKEKETLIKLKENLLSFYDTVKEGAGLKIERGLIDSLFGRNPKAQLSRIIRKATEIGKKISKQIKDENFQSFLQKFLHEAENPWNKSLYKGKFLQLYQEFSALMGSLEEKITHVHREIIAQEKAIEIWIEKHCQGR